MEKALKVENLTKLYKENRGIRDVSLNIDEGMAIGIIGPSGSGKSTLIKAMLELITKTSGKVSFYGKSLERNYVDIMNIIGYLPDKQYEFKNKAIDLLKYTSRFYDLDFTKEIEYYAKRLNVDLNKTMQEMSSGELQKVGIIEALYHKPKILFLDEPTSYLDAKSTQILLDILRELKESKVTIFIASHELSFIHKLSDEIYMLNEGKINLIDEALLKADHKKVTIALDQEFNIRKFQFNGIKYLNFEKNLVSFIYQGDINKLLKEIEGIKMNDLTIENPSIDEIIGGLADDL